MPIGKITLATALLLAGLAATPASAAPASAGLLSSLRPIIRPIPPRGAPGPIAGAGLPFLFAAAAAGLHRYRKRAKSAE